ncbi:unnamed protein product [Mytilus coruscus]|uniref:B box-type domain-containing protein n=1 Tax=Mytilus coruscus TaxID=42192 RepID=A0A6J8CJJ5_MYTCO|nr:unnamed protein product [Mytilus coruscus]
MTDVSHCVDCIRSDKKSNATEWCQNCSEKICLACSRIHRQFIPPHKVVRTEEVANLLTSITKEYNFCEYHPDEKAVLFCCQHDSIICSLCVPQTHQNCDPIISIERASKGVKSATALQDIDRRIKHLNEVMLKISTELKNSRSCLIDKEEKIKSTVKGFRKKVNEYFDKIEKELIEEMDKICNHCRTSMSQQISKLEAECAELKGYSDIISDLKKQESEISLFQTIKMLDRKTHEQEIHIQERAIVYTFEFLPLEKLTEFNTTIPSFGSVHCTNEPLVIPSIMQTEQQGQYPAHPVDHKIQMISTLNMEKLPGENLIVSESRFLPEGNIILCFMNKKFVLVCKIDGSGLEKLELDYEPKRVAVFDSKRVYTLNEKGVDMILLKPLESGKEILRSGHLYAISCSKDLICVSSHFKLTLVNIDGQIIREMKVNFDPRDIFLCEDRHIYCSLAIHPIINVVDPNGKSKYFHRDKYLLNAIGIVVNDNGDVFSCSSKYNCVFKIFQDRSKSTVILNVADGISNLTGFDFCIESKEVLVISNHGKSVSVFKSRT